MRKLQNIGLALLGAFIATFLFNIVLHIIYPEFPIRLFEDLETNGRELFYVCIFAPIVEEVLWRWAPIELVRKFSWFDKIKWPFIVLVSALFGAWHGNYFNIFVQGVTGFFLAWVYIKNNYSYWSAVATHFLFNFIVCWLGPTLISL